MRAVSQRRVVAAHNLDRALVRLRMAVSVDLQSLIQVLPSYALIRRNVFLLGASLLILGLVVLRIA